MMLQPQTTTPERPAEPADRARILVIEDSVEVARLVEARLAEAGFAVAVEADGEQGLERAQRERFVLIVLDLMLPSLDGMEVCRRLRAAGDATPILILTAKSTELDRVVGLEFGADDYVVKPFSALELIARVKAILRRVSTEQRVPSAGAEILRFGQFALDLAARELRRGGEPVPLTPKEFDLLALFAANPGRVFTRNQLLDQVWGYGDGVYEPTVTSHINRLRGKIEPDSANPTHIETVWGTGYRFRRALRE